MIFRLNIEMHAYVPIILALKRKRLEYPWF